MFWQWKHVHFQLMLQFKITLQKNWYSNCLNAVNIFHEPDEFKYQKVINNYEWWWSHFIFFKIKQTQKLDSTIQI